jgi:hypothetical protein
MRQPEQRDIKDTIRNIAEEQVLFLRNRYRMEANEIITLYTGERVERATYSDAIQSIAAFNMQNAKENGFVAT